jgi:predicted metal-dependent enzyme (double-stranded beta helix superfamily)
MSDRYTLDAYIGELRRISASETDPATITTLVAPLARKFAQGVEWSRPEYRACDPAQGYGVHLLHEEPDHDLAVFLISWLPGRGTAPHNHKTWAVVVGLAGEEQETNYERLDRGETPGHAELVCRGVQTMRAGDLACCYPEHIHAVRNVGTDIAMSLHTYGRHLNHTGRSEFDLAEKRERPFVVKIEEPARA